VLTKKKGVKQNRVGDVLADISENVGMFAPEISDQVTAYRRQRDTLLYTLSYVLLALAEDVGSTLLTSSHGQTRGVPGHRPGRPRLEVLHSSETVGLWAVSVRPPTEIAGFSYPRVGCVSLPQTRYHNQ
jgi:hypothetical protein